MKPGWINRQFARIERDYETWPDWMRRETEKRIADVPQLARGKVWCTTCGRMESVDSGECLQSGWPKCCGYTMTIDSPEERRQFTASKAGGKGE